MHDNPRAKEEEQELTQTQRIEEEGRRGGYASGAAADEDEE